MGDFYIFLYFSVFFEIYEQSQKYCALWNKPDVFPFIWTIKAVKQSILTVNISVVMGGPQLGINFKGLYGNLGGDGNLYLDGTVATQVCVYIES